MKVQFRDAKVTKDFRDRVEGRLGLALGRFGERIERVTVRVSSIGDERRCQIEVSLRGTKIHVEGLNADAFAAADHAISRAGSSVARAIERELM